MAQEMETRVQDLGIDDAAAKISQQWGIDMTPYGLLTTASLVQEEAGSAEEAPKVATVIYNRLRDGTPLGIDATSKYLAGLEGGDIDFESDSPYNTRKQAGLPPTPIASPGEYAARRRLQPGRRPVDLLRAHRPWRAQLHRELRRVPGVEGHLHPEGPRLWLTGRRTACAAPPVSRG